MVQRRAAVDELHHQGVPGGVAQREVVVDVAAGRARGVAVHVARMKANFETSFHYCLGSGFATRRFAAASQLVQRHLGVGPNADVQTQRRDSLGNVGARRQ